MKTAFVCLVLTGCSFGDVCELNRECRSQKIDLVQANAAREVLNSELKVARFELEALRDTKNCLAAAEENRFQYLKLNGRYDAATGVVRGLTPIVQAQAMRQKELAVRECELLAARPTRDE